MKVSTVLLEAAAAFKASSKHFGAAEGLAVKAHDAAEAGSGSIAALHRANVERALAASVRSAREGQELVAQAPLRDLASQRSTVLRHVEEALDSLREADSRAYQHGADSLVRTSTWDTVNQRTVRYASTTNAREDLLQVAGEVHSVAVLPPPI